MADERSGGPVNAEQENQPEGPPRQIIRERWREILARTLRRVGDDNLDVVAAGVAFYTLLAIFPALAVLVSLMGLIVEPGEVSALVGALGGVLPADVRQLLEGQLGWIVSRSSADLSLSAAAALLFTIWSASEGLRAMIMALNITYARRERRSFLRRSGLALLFTVGALLFGVIAVALIALFPAFVGRLALPQGVGTLLSLLRWPVLLLFLMAGLAALYRYGPDRDEPQWPWVSWGSIIATLLWLAGSGLFSLYVSRFGKFNETYGSLGAVVVLLLWLFLGAFAVLLGAELNAQIELQRRGGARGPLPAAAGASPSADGPPT